MPNYLRMALRKVGYDLVRLSRSAELPVPADATPAEIEIYEKTSRFTMTSIERIITLMRAVDHVVTSGIEGDIVECGVWRGGSMMAVAYKLLQHGQTDRQLYLYDTYAGMSEPSHRDARHDGEPASALLAGGTSKDHIWAYASLEDVTANLAATGYPPDGLRFVKGKVEETIPDGAPARIALLHLDTDWYESTKHELVHLYPRLARHGILIIDDYGYWRGARDATDEFFEDLTPRPFLNRVDFTARLVVKP